MSKIHPSILDHLHNCEEEDCECCNFYWPHVIKVTTLSKIDEKMHNHTLNCEYSKCRTCYWYYNRYFYDKDSKRKLTLPSMYINCKYCGKLYHWYRRKAHKSSLKCIQTREF